MVAPIIALRFRDTVVGVDTIEEHRKLITSGGQVGWGWWKKAFENYDLDEIVQLTTKPRGGELILIDTSTRRAFMCRCQGFVRSDEVNGDIVPAYYREQLDYIPGVFVLESILDTAFDPDLAARIGEQTLLRIDVHAGENTSHLAQTAEAVGRSCILHLSDLHFGTDYGFRLQGEELKLGDSRKTLTECIVNDLKRLGLVDKIAAVIVTGDFMTKGGWGDSIKKNAFTEFEALREQLSLKSEQIIPVAGNHDVVRYPNDTTVDVKENAVERQATYEHEVQFRFFVHQLVGREVTDSLNYVRRLKLGQVDLDICVLNSCTISATKWTEYGYVGKNGLDAIIAMSSQKIERPTFRFLALHHHLLPVAQVEAPESKGVTLTLDASEILAVAQKAGVNVALHGHQHKPKIAVYHDLSINGADGSKPIHVVANGSAGARNERLPAGERNTYCLFQVNAEGIQLWIRELRLDGEVGAQIFSGELVTEASLP